MTEQLCERTIMCCVSCFIAYLYSLLEFEARFGPNCNLSSDIVTMFLISTHLGVYGDVHRVKILFNKKDNALIQMAEPHQAQLGKLSFDTILN